MSADNFVVIKKFHDGYRWGMGFASCEDEYPDKFPDDWFRSDPFPTPEAAAQDALDGLCVIEYGFRFQQ